MKSTQALFDNFVDLGGKRSTLETPMHVMRKALFYH